MTTAKREKPLNGVYYAILDLDNLIMSAEKNKKAATLLLRDYQLLIPDARIVKVRVTAVCEEK